MRVSIDPLSGRIVPQPCPTPFLPAYNRVPLFQRIVAGGSKRIEAGGGTQIFSKGLGTAQGIVIQKRLTIKSDSSAIVESGSMVTILAGG